MLRFWAAVSIRRALSGVRELTSNPGIENVQASDAAKFDNTINLICFLGYFLGQSTVWLMCAQALAVFDISKCIEGGMEVTPEFNLVGETILYALGRFFIVTCTTNEPVQRSSHQAPFKCSIKPRSTEARRLICEEFPLLEHSDGDE